MSLSPGYFKKGMTMRAVWTLFLTAVLWISAPLQAAENVTYYHNDALGSPVAATDADGNLLWREIYEPFGRRFEQDPSSDGNSRWYTGHQETDYGLVYMGARHYDPLLGRFLSVDPVRFVESNPTSFNRFAYANNNPYIFVDPDGEWGIRIIPKPNPSPKPGASTKPPAPNTEKPPVQAAREPPAWPEGYPKPRPGESQKSFDRRVKQWDQQRRSQWREEVQVPPKTSGGPGPTAQRNKGIMDAFKDTLKRMQENLESQNGADPFIREIDPLGAQEKQEWDT